MTEKNFEEPPAATGSSEGAVNSNENVSETEPTDVNNHMASLKNEILNFLCQNNEIIFKSQQIDDPELTISEKKEITNQILEKSRGNFLSRFGRYLQNEHLNYFEIKTDNDGDDGREMNVDEDEEDYEVKFLLKELRKNLAHKHKNIKNRRYAAMQTLIKENSYFSEKEMMQRQPHLYEQFIGQYLTESEKRVRDSYDPKNTTFSNIILDNIDKKRMDELRKKQENEEQQSDDIASQSSSSCGSGGNSLKTLSEIGTPPACRKQWGNFDDESDDQDQPTTSSNSHRKNQKQKLITAGEREMLRQEFIGIMYSKFLEGEDEDFDYSKVDDNADLDDLKQINQDKEDKYFDGSDDDDNLDTTSYRDINRMDDDDEDEDELDVYMKHLSRHPALRKGGNDEEENEEEEEEDDD